MHWLACLTNSVGLVLTLVTLSSNCLKLTTSLLEGYINGQVGVLNNNHQQLMENRRNQMQISLRLASPFYWF